jgi:hypothetical protein
MKENDSRLHFQPALILCTQNQPRNEVSGLPHAWDSSINNLWYVGQFISHLDGGQQALKYDLIYFFRPDLTCQMTCGGSIEASVTPILRAVLGVVTP